MVVADAQREVRVAFLGGFISQLVSGLFWLASAALGTWGTVNQAIVVLVIGAFLTFPLSQMGFRMLRRPGTLSADNPLGDLALQIGFVLPLCLPVVAAAALYRLEWFYPALMVVLGAHYLPYTFLYGMRMFLALGVALVAAGVILARLGSVGFSAGAWVTAPVLLLFAVIGLVQVRREETQLPRA